MLHCVHKRIKYEVERKDFVVGCIDPSVLKFCAAIHSKHKKQAAIMAQKTLSRKRNTSNPKVSAHFCGKRRAAKVVRR